jgi:putative tryptophan/tyrosine transport system substrate-binding protein
VTGFSSQSLELESKRLELMRELRPGISRVVMLGNTPNAYIDLAMDSVERLATAAGLEFDGVKIDSANGLGVGLDIVKAQPDAVLVAAATAFFPYRKTIVGFMADNRLPAIYGFPEFAEVGGLISYSTNFDELFRHAAGYVDRILRGTCTRRAPGAAGCNLQAARQSDRGKGSRPDHAAKDPRPRRTSRSNDHIGRG